MCMYFYRVVASIRKEALKICIEEERSPDGLSTVDVKLKE